MTQSRRAWGMSPARSQGRPRAQLWPRCGHTSEGLGARGSLPSPHCLEPRFPRVPPASHLHAELGHRERWKEGERRSQPQKWGAF